MKDIKESKPITTAEYAPSNDLMDEPAFKWWATYTLKKRDHIICAIVRRIKKDLKYGIKVPETVGESYHLDTENANTFWTDAITKEMKNVSIAFSMTEEGDTPPPGYKHIVVKIIFDVKLDFTRKVRWVVTGHKTLDPIRSTYAGVVSRESVRIAFTYAALNDLDVLAADPEDDGLHSQYAEITVIALNFSCSRVQVHCHNYFLCLPVLITRMSYCLIRTQLFLLVHVA